MNRVMFPSILFFTLSICAGSVEQIDKNSIANIQKLLMTSDGKHHLFGIGTPPDAKGNCSYSPYNIQLEGYRIQDQPLGALTTSGPLSSRDIISPFNIANHINMSFDYVRRPANTDVTLIVVDDFEKRLKVNKESGFSGPTHGSLILNQTKMTIQSIKENNRISLDIIKLRPNGFQGAGEFGIVATTTSIANSIQEKIRNNKLYVVNMSFVILSCAVIKDYENWQRKNDENRLDFKAYSESILSRRPSIDINEGTRAILSPDETQEVFKKDPLEVLSENTSGVRYVAAAGNYGLPYPLFPAAWPKVLGVAASDTNGADPTDTLKSDGSLIKWSNHGDIKEFGQWLTQDIPFNTGSTSGGTRKVYYRGTSFSTPIASLIVALNLSHGFKACGFDNLAKAYPTGNANKPMHNDVTQECFD